MRKELAIQTPGCPLKRITYYTNEAAFFHLLVGNELSGFHLYSILFQQQLRIKVLRYLSHKQQKYIIKDLSLGKKTTIPHVYSHLGLPIPEGIVVFNNYFPGVQSFRTQCFDKS